MAQSNEVPSLNAKKQPHEWDSDRLVSAEMINDWLVEASRAGRDRLERAMSTYPVTGTLTT